MSSLGIDLTSMAKLVRATEAYYLTVEGFITSNPLLLNLRCVADHIERECGMHNFSGGHVLVWKNRDACADTLMNGHWKELIGKVEELLHATDNSENYYRHIRLIIQFSSNSR